MEKIIYAWALLGLAIGAFIIVPVAVADHRDRAARRRRGSR